MIKSGEFIDRFVCYCMGGGGSSPPPPTPAPPPVPTTDNAEAIARTRDERTKALAAQGLGTTILTGGLGASDFQTAGKGTVLGSSKA